MSQLIESSTEKELTEKSRRANAISYKKRKIGKLKSEYIAKCVRLQEYQSRSSCKLIISQPPLMMACCTLVYL
jgi:hypothetical protein